MATKTDLVNLALQALGTRTTVTTAELNANGSNEAIQANIAYDVVRQDLLRMAPWDCGFNTANLVYITSATGTPENIAPAVSLWQKGQPAPPYAYEYQYPVDCLKACWVTPQYATGFAGGIPITTAVTGGAPSFWQGMPVKFKVGIDQFIPVTAAAVVSGGTGHAVGDTITLPLGPITSPPIGAPVQLLVTSAPAGVIGAVSVVPVIDGEAGGGSYFSAQAGTIAQASSTGAGINASFTLTFGPAKSDQRVILTNQEFAILNYVRDVTDINVFDNLFYSAFSHALASKLVMALVGDKTLANMSVALANEKIGEARKADGNEGLTVNDIMPDFLRIRGVNFTDGYSSPYGPGFDWGNLWPSY